MTGPQRPQDAIVVAPHATAGTQKALVRLSFTLETSTSGTTSNQHHDVQLLMRTWIYVTEYRTRSLESERDAVDPTIIHSKTQTLVDIH